MTQPTKGSDGLPAFAEVRKRYEDISKRSPGFKAQLGKRIGSPDDLSMVPGFYRLFPGISPSEWHYRAAFIVPFLRHSDKEPGLGEFIGEQERLNKVGSLERRILQIARAAPHQDIIYLRRLLMRFNEPAINWHRSGLAQFFSIEDEKNAIGKKILVEQYFVARHKAGKGE